MLSCFCGSDYCHVCCNACLMRNFIVSIVLAALIIISGLLNKTWAGFYYFALVFACLLGLYWAVILIIRYIEDFHKNTEEKYNLYIAKLVNRTTLTLEQINMSPKLYKKKFRRSLWKEKCKALLPISFALGVFIVCLVFIFIR